MKVTRRKLAVMLGGPAAVLAQTQAAGQPATQDEELRAARERQRANAATLAGHQIPMAVEPAFQFKA